MVPGDEEQEEKETHAKGEQKTVSKKISPWEQLSCASKQRPDYNSPYACLRQAGKPRFRINFIMSEFPKQQR